MTIQSARKLARFTAAKYHVILSEKLIGFYLHGSMTLGGFNEGSDLDFLVVTSEEPTREEKQKLISLLLTLDSEAPKKGFEMSVADLKDVRDPHHPIPYYLHFSNGWKESAKKDIAAFCDSMRGNDPDLAAHFTVIRQCGEALIGPPPEKIFAPIPREDYIDSIIGDIADAQTDIIRDPVYITLNLCRVTAACEKGLILSKADGGEWGIANLPTEYSQLIRTAADIYLAGNGGITADRLPELGWIGFAEYCLKRLSPYIK